jgi:lipoprotein-releasing system permease protein
MFKPLAFSIGLRYTRAKRRSHFVSFISLVSMLGIAIGVAVLVTVLSVMNGFDEEIHHRFFGMAPEITVSTYTDSLSNWGSLVQKVSDFPGVTGVSPYVGGQGLLTYHGQIVPIIATGIRSENEASLIHLDKKIVRGKLTDLKGFGMVLGAELAKRLGVIVGDKITLMIPKATVTMVGMVPRFKRFTVVGVFSAGSGFNFDSKLAFINLHDAQKLFQLGDKVNGLRVKINDVYQAPKMASALNKLLGEKYYVGNWTEQFGAFFKAVKMEKTMMFLILLLIIAVAAFNLVSSLVMMVNDKRADIAILRTLGASPSTILCIFMVQGSVVGCIGILIGLIGGLLLAWNATDIVAFLQRIFDLNILSSNVYFVDYLPSKIEPHDILIITASAVLMSFLATLYPAYKASRVEPCEALRYE